MPGADDRVIVKITARQALTQLGPAHREVIEAVDIAGFRYVETAKIQACSPAPS